MPLRTLNALLLLAMPVLAQEAIKATPPQKKLQVQNPDVAAGEAGEAGSTDGKEGKEKTEPTGPPAPRSAHGQCHLVGSVQPKRVLPGSSGTLVVVMVMESDAVLVAPPPVTFQIPPDQGPVHLGQPQFHEAKTASTALAPGFQGRAVYEDTAIFEVPFTVAGDTKFGKYPVGVCLEFDLNLGRTAQLIGRFVDHTSIEVEVGIPVQAVAAMPTGAKGQAPGQPAGTDQTRDGTGSTPAVPKSGSHGGNGPIQGNIAAAPVAELPSPPTSAPEPQDSHPIGSQDGNMLGLIAAGGVLVLVLLAIVLARKR